MTAGGLWVARRCAIGFLAALALAGAASAQQGTMVRVASALGPIDIELFDTGAPATVANFLGYVRRGAYAGSFIHRSIPGFVVQGGGYTVSQTGIARVPAAPPVINEFSPARSNLRGTVAMAKLPNQPDSATSEWFVNLADNATNLDNQNGGFTVFGRVTPPSLATVDRIAALPRVNAGGAGGAFETLPVRRTLTSNDVIQIADLVTVSEATVLPARDSLADADRIFDYLEAAYPQFVSPAGAPSVTVQGYYVRYYAQTDSYVGVKDGEVYYLVPAIDRDIHRLESVAVLLGVAAAAGY